AIKVFEELRDAGRMPEKYGIRLDSGDLAYLSKKSRKMLDAAGFANAKITASSDLDEYLIDSLKTQGAKIDSWGVGTKLITSRDCPSFGGVYKLAAIKKEGKFIPKIKLSENQWKITNPGNKKIVRIYEKESGKLKADLIALADEEFSENDRLLLFDPVATWKKTYLDANTYVLRELLVPIFLAGKCVYTSPSVMDIRDYCLKEQDTLWDEARRLINPHIVYVDLSVKLYRMKTELLDSLTENTK
ncbi:MAG: pncB, partial [Herbinix sp.]|nr:pncB [Herbinix sp.]